MMQTSMSVLETFDGRGVIIFRQARMTRGNEPLAAHVTRAAPAGRSGPVTTNPLGPRRFAMVASKPRAAAVCSSGWDMMDAGLVIIYVVFCLLVGLCGTRRRIGFFGTFLASFLVTPVVVVIVLVLTEPRHRVQR